MTTQAMNTITRRQFVVSSGAAAGGTLALGFVPPLVAESQICKTGCAFEKVKLDPVIIRFAAEELENTYTRVKARNWVSAEDARSISSNLRLLSRHLQDTGTTAVIDKEIHRQQETLLHADIPDDKIEEIINQTKGARTVLSREETRRIFRPFASAKANGMAMVKEHGTQALFDKCQENIHMFVQQLEFEGGHGINLPPFEFMQGSGGDACKQFQAVIDGIGIIIAALALCAVAAPPPVSVVCGAAAGALALLDALFAVVLWVFC
jgi:hypothetical protein